MTLDTIVGYDLLKKYRVYDRAAKALIKKIPSKHRRLRTELSSLIGVGVEKYAEIFAAVVYDSKLLGGNYMGQDLEAPIEVKFGNFTYSANGSYTCSIGGLKNKTVDLFLVLSDEEFADDHPKFIRIFKIPFKVWRNRVPKSNRLEISVKKDKTSGGWYAPYEVDSTKLFA
jgi:hypothetical protein